MVKRNGPRRKYHATLCSTQENMKNDALGSVSIAPVRHYRSHGFQFVSLQNAILEREDVHVCEEKRGLHLTISAGQIYGLSSQSNWKLPNDGGLLTSSSIGIGPGGNALFTVVPEPSTYAAICGIFVLGIAIYRKHHK